MCGQFIDGQIPRPHDQRAVHNTQWHPSVRHGDSVLCETPNRLLALNMSRRHHPFAFEGAQQSRSMRIMGPTADNKTRSLSTGEIAQEFRQARCSIRAETFQNVVLHLFRVKHNAFPSHVVIAPHCITLHRTIARL